MSTNLKVSQTQKSQSGQTSLICVRKPTRGTARMGALFPWGARYSIPLTRADISVLGVERVPLPVIGRRRHLSLGVSAWERTPNGLCGNRSVPAIRKGLFVLCPGDACRHHYRIHEDGNQRAQLESAFSGARSCAPISIARTLPWTLLAQSPFRQGGEGSQVRPEGGGAVSKT